ncbi:hypothetical protein FB561_2687 [Kribbella amoyensis]|uniref:Copper(I)-binding protein n=1 Tax=Kribbella amoyensis TaxID=996641 RepID=A0A561BRR7_9ACTN|nr:hypothetical protein [Kribbella amoyensis]TWD81571.1 hypothetical protein FB561_2687 [Kribbella amoyensis]
MPITLTRQAVRRTFAATATVTLSIALTACGANFNAQTAQPYQPAEGTNADSGSIAVRNLLVMASEDGKGELHGAIVNNGADPDTLVSIASAPEGTEPAGATEDPVSVTFGNVRPMTLVPGQMLSLPPATGAPFTVTGGKPGDMVAVTITFGKAAPITTAIPVLTLDHYSPSPRADGGEAHG